MRIFHISDNHGYFPMLQGEFDVVIHSGDFFSNHVFGPKKHWSTLDAEVAFQRQWLASRIETIKTWLQDRPLLFCSGNHDFIDPCEALDAAGVRAINLDDKVIEFEGKTLYGLPWVPYIEGLWNFELSAVEMRAEIHRMLEKLRDHKARPDILVAHSPPHGILDSRPTGPHLGNSYLVNALNYSFEQLPILILCGHIHFGYGLAKLSKCTISNGSVADMLSTGQPVPDRILEV